MHSKYKILLCTQGSQGIETVRQLFALGYSVNDILCVTIPSTSKNSLFIDFLKWNGIEYICCENKEYENMFINIEIDYLISVSWRDIFSLEFLNTIKKGCLNFHAGILPYYRGCYSVSWAIINDEKYVGYTWHKISSGIDTGDILYQDKIEILDNNAHTLHYKIFKAGISNLGKALENLECDKTIVNDVEKGKYYKDNLPYNGIIDKSWTNDVIERFIRAMYFPPFKSAVLYNDGKESTIDNYKQYLENKK